MKKYAIMTMKGGTGKTTTAINLAHGLTLSGKRVLLVDCDPQRNVAVTFGVEARKGLDILLTKGDVEILQVRKNLFVIDSGGRGLVEAELTLGQTERRERRMIESLRYLKGCEYVICDCPPSMNLITVNVLAYCDTVIIPISMDFLSQVGAHQTMDVMKEIEWLTKKQADRYKILPTFYDGRVKISKEVLESVQDHFAKKIFKTVIRVNSALREAPGFNKTIFEHAPLSRGAFDYYRLTEEVMVNSNEES
ncbi:MAG TPA: ParA family protein [Patescibacteria group bacterium]|nr:ParA family protein [Patescibacteria group bacterium]